MFICAGQYRTAVAVTLCTEETTHNGDCLASENHVCSRFFLFGLFGSALSTEVFHLIGFSQLCIW